MHRPTRLVAIVLLALASGCAPSLDVEPEALLECEGPTDCPDDWSCKDNIGRCVHKSNTDNDGPVVSGVVLSPDPAGPEATLTLSFEVDELLFDDPVVVVATSTGESAMTLDENTTDREGLAYVFTLVLGAESPGGDGTVTATLLDQVGNQTRSTVATATWDFTPPDINGFAWGLGGRTAINGAAVVDYAGRVELGATVVSATLTDEAGATLADLTAGTTVVESTTVSGQADISGTVDFATLDLTTVGTVEVALVMQDAVGNQNAPPAWTGKVSVDLDPPTAPTIDIDNTPVTSVQANVVTLSAIGATEFQLSGDVIDDGASFEWLPMAATVPVQLTTGDGPKTIIAVFRDGAWNETSPVSVTTTLATGTVVSKPTLTPPAGQTAIKDGDVLTVGGTAEPGATIVSARLVDTGDDSDVQLLTGGEVTLDASGNFSGSISAAGLPDGRPVALEVVVNARGQDSVGADSRSAALDADLTPPSKPDPIKLRLVEAASLPDDPSTIAEDQNSYTLTGLAGAAVGGATLRVYQDPGPAKEVASEVVAGDASFAAISLAHHAGVTWHLQSIDGAANVSGVTDVTVPRFTSLTATPTLAGSADTVTVTFTASTTIAGDPTVTVGGNPATRTGNTGNDWTYTFTPLGDEPAGTDAAVVRVTGSDGSGSFAAGTTGTAAITMTLDTSAPTLTGASVSLSQNDPGANDTIVGGIGSVAETTYGPESCTVTIYESDGTTLIATRTPAADGSWPVLDLGDDVRDGVVVTVTDIAGNTASASFANDIQAPAVTGLALTPTLARHGQTLTLAFTVTDDASDLRAHPVVTVAGRAATRTSGTLTTSDLSGHAYQFDFVVDQTDGDGTVPVVVTTIDAVGNQSSVSTTVDLDSTPPTFDVAIPSTSQTTWNGNPFSWGQANDAFSGVAQVEVSLQRVGSGLYWTGAATGFDSATEVYHPATGAGPWTWSFGDVLMFGGESYRYRVRAVDVAGNVSTPVERVFIHDDLATPGPTSETATSVGEAHIRVDWFPASLIDHYLLRYGPEGSPVPAGGVGAAEGDSPIVIPLGASSFDITELPRGRWSFALTAVSSTGLESVVNTTVTAASRWWAVRDSGTTESLEAVWSNGTDAVAVGTNGTIVRSGDGGATWAPAANTSTTTFNAAAGNGQTILATGGDTHRSTDGGVTWTKVFGNGVGGLKYAAASWGNTFVITGLNRITATSTDLGVTWTQTGSNRGGAFKGIGGDGNTVITVGDGGNFDSSVDGGVSFTQGTPVVGNGLNAVAGAMAEYFAVGAVSVVLYSGNDGTSWSKSYPITTTWQDIWSDDQGTGVGVGTSGTIATFAGGVVTAATTNPATFGLTAVDGLSMGSVYVAGAAGHLLRSPGPPWDTFAFVGHFDPADPGQSLRDVFVRREGDVLVVGSAGTILQFGPE